MLILDIEYTTRTRMHTNSPPRTSSCSLSFVVSSCLSLSRTHIHKHTHKHARALQHMHHSSTYVHILHNHTFTCIQIFMYKIFEHVRAPAASVRVHTRSLTHTLSLSLMKFSGPEIAMLFLFICLLMGCAARFVLDIIKSRWGFRIPYSVVLLTVGGLWGALAYNNIQQVCLDIDVCIYNISIR